MESSRERGHGAIHASAAGSRGRVQGVKRGVEMVWGRGKIIARNIGDFQARVLLSVFYFIVFGPFALGVKMFSDPLRLRPHSRQGWLERASLDGDPTVQARRQF